jgi:hypothetical protein
LEKETSVFPSIGRFRLIFSKPWKTDRYFFRALEDGAGKARSREEDLHKIIKPDMAGILCHDFVLMIL